MVKREGKKLKDKKRWQTDDTDGMDFHSSVLKHPSLVIIKIYGS